MNEQQLSEIELRASEAMPSPLSIRVTRDGRFMAHARDDVLALVAEVRQTQAALIETLQVLSERQNCEICHGAGGYYMEVGAEGEDVSWEDCECADFAAEVLEKYAALMPKEDE